MPSSSKKEKGSGNLLSFLFSIFFFVLFSAAIHLWYKLGIDPMEKVSQMTPWEGILIVLAVYRMTRLVVYDKIMNYFRDIFLDVEEISSPDTGIVYVIRNQPKNGIRRLFSELLSCPWCASMWLSLVVIIFHFTLPQISWPFIFILAVGAVASSMQIFMNMIGWYAEARKREVQNMK